MRPTGQIPFSLQSVNRQRLTDGYVPPAISGQWLIDELGFLSSGRKQQMVRYALSKITQQCHSEGVFQRPSAHQWT